jgi:hypothetical protein
MMRILCLAVLACLAPLAPLLATGWVPARQEGGIAVVGQVTNGTPGGSVPADLSVVLHVFSGTEESGTYTTTAAADGSFRFDNLALEVGQTVITRVVYRQVAYLSELHVVEIGEQTLSLPVTVYEITEDSSALVVTQAHMFVSRAGDHLQVGEYYLVSNTGDRTCVGVEVPGTGHRTTLSFTLPDGAEGLSFEGPGLGERYLDRPGGFADTRPVIPGTATVEVLFRYDFPDRERVHVERVFDVPVTSIVLVIPEGDIVLEGGGLVPAGRLNTETGPSLSYTAGPLAAGEALAFTLVAGPRSLPAAVGGAAPVRIVAAPARNTAAEMALGLVALAVGLVTFYLVLRSPVPGAPPALARPLVDSIAALDARFEAGELAEMAYHQQRASLKAQLRSSIEPLLAPLPEAGKQQPGQD